MALQTNDKDQRNLKLEQAKSALAQVWKRTSCDDKCHDLMNSRFSHVDFLSALVILEDLLLDQSKKKDKRDLLYTRLFEYFSYCHRNIQTTLSFTTGSMLQENDLHDCFARIERLRQESDTFIVQHLRTICSVNS